MLHRYFLIVLVVLTAVACLGQDSDEDDITDARELELARAYAPVLRLASGEKYFPTPVGYALQNSQLKAYEDGEALVVLQSPSESDLAGVEGEGYFLDNIHGGDERDIREHFRKSREAIKPTVYALVSQGDEYLRVEYWMYYPYNSGPLRNHEGDWESIQILVRDDRPFRAVFSQGTSSLTASWRNVLLKDGHPLVYVAKGSHSNYFRPYQGVLGVHLDDVGGGRRLGPGDYELVLLGDYEEGAETGGWNAFPGRWGEWSGTEEQPAEPSPFGPGRGEDDYWDSDYGMRMLDAKGGLWLDWLVASFALFFTIYLLGRVGWRIWRSDRSRWNLPRLWLGPLGYKVAIAGTLVGLLAIALPWYYFDFVQAKAGLEIEGRMLLLDGLGLQTFSVGVNRGLACFFCIRLPWGLLMVSSLAFTLLDIVAVESPHRLRRRFLRGGAFNVFVPLLPLIIFFAFFGYFVQGMAFLYGGEEDGAPESVSEMSEHISSRPWGAKNVGNFVEEDEVELRWGLGLGALLMVAAGVLKLTGGLLLPTPLSVPEGRQTEAGAR